jgi:hypothetical protein
MNHPWHYYVTSIEATDEENLAYAHWHTDAQYTWGLKFVGTYPFDIVEPELSH